jgi:hypothetical protein
MNVRSPAFRRKGSVAEAFRLKAGLRTIFGAMLDLIFVAATILFFLLSLAYVRGCEKL